VSRVRSAAAIVGATLLLASLVGCTAVAIPAASARHSAASARSDARFPLVGPTPYGTSSDTAMVVAPPRVKVPKPSPFCTGNAAGVHHIYVNIALQHLWACTGAYLFTDTAVTTGAWKLPKVNDATPTGTFRIYGKMRNVVLSGHDIYGSWHDHVAYWMPFVGPYGFHDASWQTFPYGSSLYSTKGSHGCVHVPVAVLGKIFNWAPIGTLVTIVHR
jgi:hypothetical protein